MNFRKVLVIFISLFTVFSTLKSQNIAHDVFIGDTTQTHILETKKEDSFVGKALSIDNLDISFLFTDRDTLHFKLTELNFLRVYDPAKPARKETKAQQEAQTEEELYSEWEQEEFRIPGTERVFMTPSAFTLKKNRREYRNIDFLLNSSDIGLSDHISIGFDFLPLIIVNFIGVRAKAAMDVNDKIHLGLGARLHYMGSFFTEGTSLASYYASATYGSREKFLNFSYGLLSSQELGKEVGQSFSLGGSLRISEHWKLMAESFYSTIIGREEYPNYIFAGASYFGHKHRLDFGLALAGPPEQPILPLPIVGYGMVLW